MASLQEVWRWIDANRRKSGVWLMEGYNKAGPGTLSTANESVHFKKKCTFVGGTFLWGYLPMARRLSSWALEDGPGSSECACECPGAALKVWLSAPLFPPKHLPRAQAPAVSLSLALCVAGQCEKPPEFPEGARPPSPPPPLILWWREETSWSECAC